MKRLLLAALVLAALPLAAFAQSAVPLQISYQGKVTDAAGVPLGNTTPVNRTVTFRIWDHATATATVNRLYTESQTVTIANGEFSVLIGNGSVVGAEVKPALDTVFTGATRYIGITVDDGIVNVDPEISPRQQIVADVYSFRAKVAESVLGQAISTAMIANNAVTSVQIADSAVTNAKLLANVVDTAKLADNAITSAKIVDGTIATADLAAGAVTAAKLGSDVGAWATSGGNVYRTTGNVGVGTNVPTALISAGGVLGNSKIAVYDDGVGGRMGLGVQGSQFRLHLNQSSDRFSFLSAQAGTEIVTFAGTGNVGIDHTSPPWPLTIANATDARMAFQTGSSGTASSDGFHVGAHGSAAYLWNMENTILHMATNGTERLRIEADGRMGFNGANGDGNIGYTMKSPNASYILWITDRNGNLTHTFQEGGGAFKPGGGSWAATSDARLKKDVTNLRGSLEKLLSLRSVSFLFKDQERYPKGPQVGFIAQEVQKIFPDWVLTGPDQMLAVSPKAFESHTIQALRELRAEKDAQIAALEARVKSLESQAAEANARFAAIERRINSTATAAVTASSPR